MFKIATTEITPTFAPKSGGIVADHNIRFTDWTRSDRAKRQIIEAIEAHECPKELADYVESESLMIDALYLFDPAMAEDIEVAARDHTAILQAGIASIAASGSAPAIPAIAQSSQSQTQERIMFATNTNEGSKGPWMSWTSNGSAAKGFAPKSWVIRGTDDNDNRYEQVFEGFANPCVFDLDSLKLGWEKDGAQGQSPERRYSSHYSVAMSRPDESKKPNNAFTWSNCLQVRVATSQTQAVTWEQGSFGAYEAFTRLARLIEAEWAANSQNGALLPVVQMTSVETCHLKGGDSNIPILTIVRWAPRPDVLKDDAPAIATSPAPAPAPAPAQAPQAAPAPAQPQAKAPVDNSAVSAAGGF